MLVYTGKEGCKEAFFIHAFSAALLQWSYKGSTKLSGSHKAAIKLSSTENRWAQ